MFLQKCCFPLQLHKPNSQVSMFVTSNKWHHKWEKDKYTHDISRYSLLKQTPDTKIHKSKLAMMYFTKFSNSLRLLLQQHTGRPLAFTTFLICCLVSNTFTTLKLQGCFPSLPLILVQPVFGVLWTMDNQMTTKRAKPGSAAKEGIRGWSCYCN